MWRLWSWIFVGILVQASPFLSVLSSETGGGIRRMAVWKSVKICAASAVDVQYSQTAANQFYGWPEAAHQNEPLRLESAELVFNPSDTLWRCQRRCCDRRAEFWPPARRLGQAYGSESDFQNFHPHLHVLSTDGWFYNDAAFMVCPPPNTGDLEERFRYEVFKRLKADGKINDVVIENMMKWPPARRAIEPTPRRAPQWI